MSRYNDTTISYFSIQMRKLEAASEPGEVVQILQELTDFGLHDFAPPPKGDIVSLLSSMEKHAANVMVQVQAFEVLVKVTTKKEPTRSVTKAGGTEIVTEVMRTHAENVDVQELGCALLANLALVARKLVREAGGIQILVNALERFQEHPAIQLSACKAISYSICTIAQADCIAPLGVIEHVLKAMKAYPNHAKVQEMCCEALAKLSLSDDGTLDIANTGGLDLVVCAMERHAHHPYIQQHACRVLYHLALKLENRGGQNMIADGGGITRILSALQLHTDHEKVQQHGYLALSVLVHIKGTPIKSICDLLKQGHDFGFVTNAMAKYVRNGRLQFACLRMILALRFSDPNLTHAMANAGIANIIHTALNRHPDYALLQSEGLLALSAFVGCYKSHRDYVVSEGGIDCVMNAMLHHENNSEVQKIGCRLFNSFCRDPLNCALIVAAGGIERVTNAMKIHKNDPEIHEEGAKFLSLTCNVGVSALSIAAAAA